MKKIACVAALVLACVPVSGLAEDSKPDIKAPEVKKPQTTKPKEKKAKSDEKKEKLPETKQLGPKSPWDIWFGAAIMSDYNFRGITQSNHRPSAASYFEPRYNFNNSLQAYLGLSGGPSRTQTAPPPRSTSTAVSGRPSPISPSILVLGTTGIRTENARTISSRIVGPVCRTATSSKPI
jgi:hypothetical protein